MDSFPQYTWIETNETLPALFPSLPPSGWVAIDTEADSLHHYRESLCLIQLSTAQADFLIDPLAQMDLAPLWPQLSPLVWILHGADYDLRLLRRAGAPESAGVFDTVLAAQILGFPAFGYAALVEKFFGITLSKASQRADWSQRPLSPEMLNYAVQDTHHLLRLADLLRAQLMDQGRLGWHEQSCARVVRTSRISRETDPEDSWRISGANRLTPEALAILREIWLWRETEAERLDRPPFKVVVNEKMLALAIWASENLTQTVDPYTLGKHPNPGRIQRLSEAVERGRQAPPVPRLPRGPRPTYDPAFDKRLESFRIKRDAAATELGIDPTFLAPKHILIELARDAEAAPEMLLETDRWCPWQAALLGVGS